MTDTTIKKVSAAASPTGGMGQKYLVSGKSMAMRLWEETAGPPNVEPTCRDYETVGYVISGRAELELEGSKGNLGSRRQLAGASGSGAPLPDSGGSRRRRVDISTGQGRQSR